MRPHTAPAGSTTDDRTLDALLRHQSGLVTRQQALAAGLSAADVDDRLRRRRWRPVQPRVYLDADHHLDTEARFRAALLWAGPGAVLSGTAAAWWHGLLDRPPASATLTVRSAARRRYRARAGVAVRSRELEPLDMEIVRGVAVTALPLTVLEAAVALGPDGGPLLDAALRGQRVRFPAVAQAHGRMRGAPGAARARVLLDAAAARSATAAVGLLVRMLRAAQMPGWRVEPGGPPGRVVFPAAGVAIELHGWAQPVGTGPAPEPAPTVLRYTWHDLVDRPTIVFARIAGAIAGGPAAARRVMSTTCQPHAGHLREQRDPVAGYPES
jgi:hypothetical protein